MGTANIPKGVAQDLFLKISNILPPIIGTFAAWMALYFEYN